MTTIVPGDLVRYAAHWIQSTVPHGRRAAMAGKVGTVTRVEQRSPSAPVAVEVIWVRGGQAIINAAVLEVVS